MLEETDRTALKRRAERGSFDPEVIHAILDEGLVCHVAFDVVDDLGQRSPVVLPMSYARVGDQLYLHAAVGSRFVEVLSKGESICANVTLIDGIVLARVAKYHSMNYRSVVMFGVPRVVTSAAEKWAALKAIVNHVVADRFSETRAPNAPELRATTVIALRISEASAKTRNAPPADLSDAPECWSGVIDCHLVFGPPTPDERTSKGNIAPPDSTRYERYVIATGR